MNNTTLLEIYSNKLDNALYISYIAWRTCGFLCTLFGLPGHIFLILITVNKTNRKESTSLYFTAIGICELVFLFGVFWLWCVGMSIIRIDPREIFSCGIFYSILIGPTILSNLYLASLSVDRTFMILYPSRFRLLITRRHVFLRILLILLIIIFFMIPNHYYYYYNKKTTIFICEFYTFIDQWRIRIWPFLHAILFVSIPYLITCISSIILLKNRCHHRRIYKNKLSANARRLERNSIIILFISIIFFFSLLPFVILQIFLVQNRLSSHGNISLKQWKTYKILLNWFLTLSSVNYSFKFYMRLIISKNFRKDFIYLFNCFNRQKVEQFIRREI